MIVIPMMGRSSRFLDVGYATPKHQLVVNQKTMFEMAVNSFSKYFADEHFLFIVRSNFDNRSFVAEQVIKLGIKDFRIIEIQGETGGQADTVFRGTEIYSDQTPIVIFNIDTIRHGFTLPSDDELGDGLLEVFKADGDNWSFVESGPKNIVVRTTEKVRISNLCSNGLYIFKSLGDFRSAFANARIKNELVNGEAYVAPLYNYLIASGKQIFYRVIRDADIETCGTPAEFEAYKMRHAPLT
jgi:dTDP-glucose pyrophosphorylase